MSTAATMPQHHTRRAHHRRVGRWCVAAIVLLAALLIGGRIYLPYYVRDYVNDELAHLNGYHGSVDSVGLSLYRGAYQLYGLKISKMDKGIPVPFVAIPHTDISVHWRALLHGRVVAAITLTQPEVNFAVSKSGGDKQTGQGVNWNQLSKKLIPVNINVIALDDGKISYKDFSSNPPADIFIHHLNGQLTNLRNVEEKDKPLPSTIDITGDSIGGGKLALRGRMNILTPDMDMDIDTRLEGAKLAAFNSYTDNCCAVEFKGGTLDVYSEMAVRNGNLNGYVKPLVHDLSVEKLPKSGNPVQMAWSWFASVLLEVFKNQPHDQFATKVPITGHLGSIETEFWPTLGGVLRNAFVEAFKKGTDNEIGFDKKTAPAQEQ